MYSSSLSLAKGKIVRETELLSCQEGKTLN